MASLHTPHGPHGDQHGSAARYVWAWAILMVLALGSYLASAAHLGVWDIVVALVIALLKTGIVLWVFMELNQHRFINQLVVLFSVGLAALLLALMVADVLTRRTFPRAPIATEAERNRLP